MPCRALESLDRGVDQRFSASQWAACALFQCLLENIGFHQLFHSRQRIEFFGANHEQWRALDHHGAVMRIQRNGDSLASSYMPLKLGNRLPDLH
jgi:hypothetical protein